MLNVQTTTDLAEPYIAEMPETPPAGTYWGSTSYKVDGYSVGVRNERGLPILAEPYVLYGTYGDAEAVALAAEGDRTVIMQTSIVDF
jgi:hypothetical protein